MYKCDCCSKEINKEEMKIVTGAEVSAKTRDGFVPSRVGGQLVDLGVISKEQGWATAVNQNPTSDWGFCHSCFTEFQAFGRKFSLNEWLILIIAFFVGLAFMIADILYILSHYAPDEDLGLFGIILLMVALVLGIALLYIFIAMFYDLKARIKNLITP